MAAVFLAVQENLSRMVAVKVLNMGFFSNPRMSKRFIKEARTLSALVHPNIVTIFDVGKIEKSHFIVMEFLQESLKDRLRKQRKLAPDEAIHTVRQVADALFYAHENGIIHRDVKPDNILFRKDGTPVILDFGIAKRVDSDTRLTRTGVSIGTPQYMSPEQCNAEKVDGRSDVYSLGVVFYEMLTGKPPYTGDTTMGVVMKHLNAPVPVLPKKLADYQPLLDKLMCKDRRKRLHDRDQLDEMLKPLLHLSASTTGLKQEDIKVGLEKRKKKAVHKTPATRVSRPVRKKAAQSKKDAQKTVVSKPIPIHSEDTGHESRSGARTLGWWILAGLVVFFLYISFEKGFFKQLWKWLQVAFNSILEFLF